jgi:hypothetical protein
MSKPKSNETRRIEGIATAFGLSTATIRNWKSEGCNIFDPAEIISWRQNKIEARGRGAAKRADLDEALNGHRKDSAGMLNLEVIEKLPSPTGEGAAAALKRLQGLESIFYSRQLEALAKGRSDLIAYALTDYRKITESLLNYERQVELAMRDSGQLIARNDAELGAAAVARWFRLGWRLWLSSCTPDLLALAGDARGFKSKAEETFSEIMKTVFTKAREAKIALPAWALHAVREEFRSEISEMEGSKDERRGNTRDLTNDPGRTGENLGRIELDKSPAS